MKKSINGFAQLVLLVLLFAGNTAIFGQVTPTLGYPNNGTVVYGTSVFLNFTHQWDQATELQVFINSNFVGTPSVSVSLPNTEWGYNIPTLIPGSTYYWRVRAVSGSSVSAYASTSFTTFGSAPPPSSFTLTINFAGAGSGTVSPASGTSFTSGAAVTLTASATGSSVFAGFTGAVTGGSPISITMDANKTVTATFDAPPTTPDLSSPANAESGISLSPTLTWGASTGSATIEYVVNVNTAPDFTGTPVFTSSSSPSTFATITPSLATSTSYYWKVTATNFVGSSASTVFSFTTGGPQPIVTMSSTAGITSGVSFSSTATITLNGASPSKAYQGTITYDAAKLHFNGSSASTAIILSGDAANPTWTAPTVIESPTGTLKFITFSGTDAISLASGKPLLSLNFTIITPNSGSTSITPSEFKGATANVTFGTHTAGTVTWAGGAVSVLLGDVDLDGLIDMNDVILLSTSLDFTGTPALTNPSQARTNADIRVSPSGTELNVINLNDLSDLITRVISGVFPPPPSTAAPDGELQIIAANVSQTGSVIFPITVVNASNLNNAEIIFSYDPQVISYQTFAANLKVSGYFSNAQELKPGKASFIFATGITANGNVDLGSIVLKSNDGSIPTGAVITTEYRFNAGQLQTGPTIKFGVTGVESEKAIPTSFEVEQNYPNPFNPSTIIKYGLPEASLVTIKIYNILGQEVKTLLNTEKSAGTYSVQWNGDNDFGHKVSSGTYIYRIVAGSFVETKKMVLLK